MGGERYKQETAASTLAWRQSQGGEGYLLVLEKSIRQASIMIVSVMEAIS